MLKEELLKTLAIIIFVVAAVGLIFVLLKSDLTGRAISLEKSQFLVGEPIKGAFDLKLREGELIPSATRVIVTFGNESKEISLKEFVEASGFQLEEQQGPFYLENKELEGQGFGYGFAGHYIVYPSVFFQLKISSAEENATNITVTNETLTNVTNITEENITIEENITSETEENLTGGNETKENETEGNMTEEPGKNVSGEISEVPVEENVSGEASAGEAQTEITTGTEGTASETSENSEAQTPENTPEQTPENTNPNPTSITEVTENPISGFFIFLFRTFGIWNSFAVLEENSHYKIIEASCNANEPFIYDLKEGEQVSLVQGSVHTEEKQLNDNAIALEIKNNKLEVSTNYLESFEGFGKSYLGEEHELSFNLSALNLSASEPGTYNLEIKFLYQGQELLSESAEIEIIPEMQTFTIKVIDAKGNLIDEIELSEDEIKPELKIKISAQEEIEIEKEEQEIGQGITEKITGMVPFARAQTLPKPGPGPGPGPEPIPPTPVCGNSACESGEDTENCPQDCSFTIYGYRAGDLTIQMDMPTSEQRNRYNINTEIIAGKPSADFDADYILAALDKVDPKMIVDKIVKCDNWDTDRFDCTDSFSVASNWFEDRGDYVLVNIAAFSAYAGGAGYNASLAVWDTSDEREIGVNETLVFYANYTKYPSGEPINESEGNCSIVINALPEEQMQFNNTSQLWQYSMTTTSDMVGTGNFTVSCSGNYSNLNATDDFIVSNYTAITECQSITTAGNYRLVNDIFGPGGTACISIENSAVLDCQNYSIMGFYNYGIQVSANDVSVKNCKLIGASGINYGLRFYVELGDIEGAEISSNTFVENNYGIIVETPLYNSSILNNTFLGTGGSIGISCLNCYNVGIFDNNITLATFGEETGIVGIELGGENNTVSNNSISGYHEGLSVFSAFNNISKNTLEYCWAAFMIYGSYNLITNNSAINNDYGIRLSSALGNTLLNNIAQSNTEWDYYSEWDSLNNSVTNLEIGSVIVSFESKDISLKNGTDPGDIPGGYQHIGKFINATNNSADSWLFLNVSYDESELGSLDENSLRLWKYNGSWYNETFYSSNGVDTSNNIVYANITSFSIFAPLGEEGAGGDSEAPQYSQDGDNSSGSVRQGTSVIVHVYWQDNVGLSKAIFRTNESGSWQNVSTCELSGTSGWCNATIDTSGDAGKIICWNQYANDTSNNWNNSMSETLHCFSVTSGGGGGGGGGGGTYCGDGDCDNDENCTTCPQDCHSCGDGCCSPEYGESYGNCYKDCCYPEGITRPVLPLHVCCPGLNTVIPYDMNCVARQGCAGCEAIGSVTCVRCGNGVCGLGENYCNCPQDCPITITNCSQLPKLNANISWLESSQKVKLNWQTSYELLKTNVMAADKMQGQNNLSNFSLKQQLESWQNSWQEAIPERLKFFQVIAKVKVGQGECKPECRICSRSIPCDPGWYDPCTETKIKTDYFCGQGQEPYCCFTDTRSEGWYAVNDCRSADPSTNLIKYDQCEPGEFALACNQSSDVFVKFTQPLIRPTQAPPGRNTSVNWVVYYPVDGLGNNTEEYLNSAMPIDYIARWIPEEQKQFGSARGNTSWQGSYSYGMLMDLLSKLLPGQYLDIGKVGGSYSGIGGGSQGEIVITGPFDLEQGKPYFVSATNDYEWTWVGKVPERVRFELKRVELGGGLYSAENYIVLPLDTKIKTAKDLCNELIAKGIMSGSNYIAKWDATQQQRVQLGPSCSRMPDVPLEPGESYLITVTNPGNWTQE